MKRIEADVKADILKTLGPDRENYLVWNHPTGTARSLTPPYQHVRYGLPGSPDVIGAVTVTVTQSMVGKKIAVALGIETKHPDGGAQREQQKIFQKNWEQVGAIYVLTRTAETIREDIKARLP